MKFLPLIILAFFAIQFSAFAQTRGVLKNSADNTITGDLVFPSGKTLTIAAGATLDATGATITGLAANWGTITSIPANVSALGTLANASGWLKNNGSGTLAYTTVTKSDVGLGTVENTALSTWGGTTNITMLGTLTAGAIPTTLLTGTITNSQLAGGIDLATKMANILPQANIAALTGDITKPSGSGVTTMATVNSNVGTFGGATTSLTATVNAKGLITALSSQTVTPAIGSITGFGAGIATALAVATGSSGAPVLFNGQLGIPVSGNLQQCTGLPLATGVTGLGTGVATILAATPTGTGSMVAAAGPSVTNLTTDRLTLSGNISAATWATSGLRIAGVVSTFTDTSAAGTVAAGYTDAFGGNTIAATNARTFTLYGTAWFREPVAGTNVTMTNKFAVGAESARFGTSNPVTITTAGVLSATSPAFITPALGVASATSLALTGTGGAGGLSFVPQASNPTTPASGFTVFADSAGKFSWKGSNGFVRTFDGTANTADRAYVLPDLAGTILLTASAASLFPADAGLPSQTSNSGKYLTTNGTVSSWGAIGAGLTVGTSTITSGTSGRILYNNAGVLGEMTTSGSGTVVALLTSPAFVTPLLGIPTSGTLTNCTGLPAAGVVGTAAILGANTFTGAQTITPTTPGSCLTLNSGTVTTSLPAFSIAQTWNASGTTFTGVQIAVTQTAAASASKLFDVLGGSGGSTSYLHVRKDGTAVFPGNFGVGNPCVSIGAYGLVDLVVSGSNGLEVRSNGTSIASFLTGGGGPTFQITGTTTLGFASSSANTSAGDLLLSREAAAILQQGVDAASPVAQTFKGSDARAGTDTNSAGGTMTLASGRGTGTGAISTLIIQTPVAVASGTGAQTLTTVATFSTAGDSFTGTNTNDSAAAGQMGEIQSSAVPTGSAVSLTTATGATITSLSLTPGDWSVSGNVNFNATAATVSATSGGVTTTSATVPTDGTEVYSGAQFTVTSAVDSVTLPIKRISLSATTTVYLVGKCTFSAGTVSGFGSITARRIR